jgi:DNA-binding CsgD family transcriptional regulator
VRDYWREEGMIAVTAGSAELAAHEAHGDQAAALATYRLIVETLTGIWHALFPARVRLAALTLAAFAEGAVHRSAAERADDATLVAQLVDDAHAVLERRSYVVTGWGVEARAWEARLEAEILRWRWAADVDPPGQEELLDGWYEAVRRHEVYGAPFELAVVRSRLAELLASTGDADDALDELEQSSEVARRLGAAPLLARLGAPTTPPPATEHGVTLTPRESEILALVAEGRSNGEIGRQLFISTKTVSVHVSNILGKLDASGRTEAAAIARRDGLID